MMHMTFYWGLSATLLFDQWETSSVIGFHLSLIGIFLFAILHEGLFYLRAILAAKKGSGSPSLLRDSESNVALLEKVPVPQNKWLKTSLLTVLYGLNAATSYLLMLLVMSFNGGVFLAVVFGLMAGFALFRARLDSTDSSDVCHTA